jgi:hypothetical protein
MASVAQLSPIPLPSSDFDTTLRGSPPHTFKTTAYGPSVNRPTPYPENTTFPLVLSPSSPYTSINDIVSTVTTLSHTGTIRSLLTQHGAIYFSGVNISTAEEFSQFASAFSWKPHEDIGNPLRRTVHAFNVATANEGPNTNPVYPHNEFGLSPHYPAYVLFTVSQHLKLVRNPVACAE